MNPAVYSVKNSRIIFALTFIVLVGGIFAYKNLGRLEDPEFTIKQALIVTPYPGASPDEVAKEVTNPIESAVQQMGQVDRVESESSRGRSLVRVHIKDRYHKDTIPQVWDELRRKSTMCNPGCHPRRAARRSWWTTSATFTASLWPSPARASRSPSFAAMPTPSAASCSWFPALPRSICSVSNRKSSFWKSRVHGWRASELMRTRSTPSCRRKTLSPTVDAYAWAGNTSPSILRANLSRPRTCSTW